MAVTEGKELRELVEACALAHPELATAAEALRAALKAVADLNAIATRLQREAADCEFETIPPAVRAHIDGVLLQRVGFTASRAAQASTLLRSLAQGVRDLQGDCARTVTLVRSPEGQ